MRTFKSAEVHCRFANGEYGKREIGYFLDFKNGKTTISTKQKALEDVVYFRAPGAFAPDYFRNDDGTWDRT